MKLTITGRDMLILTPGEEYDVPDEIAKQLIERGHAEIPVEPETKKEQKAREKLEKADARDTA